MQEKFYFAFYVYIWYNISIAYSIYGGNLMKKDKQGRILIPSDLRNIFSITKKELYFCNLEKHSVQIAEEYGPSDKVYGIAKLDSKYRMYIGKNPLFGDCDNFLFYCQNGKLFLRFDKTKTQE